MSSHGSSLENAPAQSSAGSSGSAVALPLPLPVNGAMARQDQLQISTR